MSNKNKITCNDFRPHPLGCILCKVPAGYYFEADIKSLCRFHLEGEYQATIKHYWRIKGLIADSEANTSQDELYRMDLFTTLARIELIEETISKKYKAK